jgi:hypothetical protein
MPINHCCTLRVACTAALRTTTIFRLLHMTVQLRSLCICMLIHSQQRTDPSPFLSLLFLSVHVCVTAGVPHDQQEPNPDLPERINHTHSCRRDEAGRCACVCKLAFLCSLHVQTCFSLNCDTADLIWLPSKCAKD